MRIGIAAENRKKEMRVILRPQELRELSDKHEILVESGAGKWLLQDLEEQMRQALE
ncbi:unnamed protein product [marine sediment metagenome]|uniref:Uncharacterized protein n=1 Tax=marine sediment metagenome TaxID=412755 RepID=X1BCV5_9ZZZZ